MDGLDCILALCLTFICCNCNKNKKNHISLSLFLLSGLLLCAIGSMYLPAPAPDKYSACNWEKGTGSVSDRALFSLYLSH